MFYKSKPALRPLQAALFAPLFWVVSATAGPVYMNDANTRTPTDDPTVIELTDDFPRVLAHEFANDQTTTEYSQYMLIVSKGQNFPQIDEIQTTLSPSTKALRHISGRAYQSWPYKACFVSAGLAFEETTAASQGGPVEAGCGIYAGHWLYKPGTPLVASIDETSTDLLVEDASRIESGQYVVIYDPPAGSFVNAEHARVTSVDEAANSITVSRAYKSNPHAHPVGAIVAQHVLGQGTNPLLWAFNLSNQSPLDANGKRFNEFFAEWLGRNLLRYRDGLTTSADIAGVMFDADFYYDLKASESDANNDLVLDNGVSSTGENWLGQGTDDFYALVRAELPGKYVLAGNPLSRGYETTHGNQLEGWLDLGNPDFSPTPQYRKVNEMFSRYLFNMSDRATGPALVQTLIKTPTKQYPGDAAAVPATNAPFRLALALALMEDGYFGSHSRLAGHAWWDEYAVITDPADPGFGRAVPATDAAAVRANRGWLGQPTGDFERVYDESLFQPGRSMISNGTFDKNIRGWNSKNVSLSSDKTGSLDGKGALRASGMITYQPDFGGANVRSKRLTVRAGTSYTVAVAMRSSADREVLVSLGNDSARLPLSSEWRRYVFTLRPTNSGKTTLKFSVGMESDPVWLDSVYVFKGDANVFRREFDRGLALANATPEPKTVVVGPGYRRISGTQDPAVNNGEAVTEVTIPPYDGLLLIRTDAASGE
jgi:hypothetical protein